MNSAINNKANNSDLTALQGVVDGKMDEMTVDSAPTSGSANLVTSGGVYTAINNKSVSDVGATVDGDNNLTITVAQADGTSKSGSVALPAGGDIEIEKYGDLPVLSATVSFNTSVTIPRSGNSTATMYTLKATETSESALYYDPSDNCLKKCTLTSASYGNSGSMSMKYTFDEEGLEDSIRSALDPFVLGMAVAGSGYLYVRVGSTTIFALQPAISNGEITSYTFFTIMDTSSGSKTFSGSYTARIMYKSSYDSCVYPVASSGSIPSTYTKIADL